MNEKIKAVLFFNNSRGLNIYNYLKKKKNIKIIKIFLSKKFLNLKIIDDIDNFKIIKNLNTAEIKKTLLECDIAVVGGFPLIFRHDLIKLPKLGIVNCHAGMLPKYRGGSPLNWQIINNEKFFGITTLKMNPKIDEGDIIKEKKFLLKKKYTINNLHEIVNQEFPKIVYKSILHLKNKKKLKKQKKINSYFPQRTKKDSLLFFKKKNLEQIKNFVRALQEPYPNPFFYFNNKKITFQSYQISTIKLKKGEILFKNKNFYLGCKNCTIKILY